MRVHFYVNVDAVVGAAEYVAGSAIKAAAQIENMAFELTKEILHDEFEYAGRLANSDGGFPQQYQDHLLGVVDGIIPHVRFNGSEILVSIDLEEELGGYDDLTRAYHRHAKLAGGEELIEPYEGQALKQEDAGIRHIYWQALQSGADKVSVPGRSGSVPIKGNWEETIREYVEIWGDKAPEWLFIQFGQEEWDPTIMQVDVAFNIENALQSIMGVTLENYFARLVTIANTYKSTGLEVGYTGDKSPPRVLSGNFTAPNGKTYRPGQFVPKGGF